MVSMHNKLDELIQKFKMENNNLGERLAVAIKEYLDDFTDSMKDKVEAEVKSLPWVVNKVVNFMINCEKENEYTARHIFPVVKEKDFYIIRKEVDDKGVLANLNTGIKNLLHNKISEFDWYQSKVIPVGYVYIEASKETLEELQQSKKYKLNITDKNGVIHELTYFLTWSDMAVLKCKKLWKMSQLYKDETPILYAPYAKRLFRIDVDVEELLSDKTIQVKTIDLKLKNNGINEILLLNKELVWNVKIEEHAGAEAKVSPVGDVLHWKYCFKELLNNQYIIPKVNCSPSFKVNVMNEKSVQYDFENEYTNSFERVTIYNFSDNDFQSESVFRPRYNENNLEKQFRIRSLADASYELKKFIAPKDILISAVQKNLPIDKMLVKKYSSNMTIYDKGRFGYKNTNRLYIIFNVDKNNVFVEDYINFVLGYLTYCFPEIGWEGAY